MAEANPGSPFVEAEAENYRRILQETGRNSWMFCKPWAIGAQGLFIEFACVMEMLQLPPGSEILELGCGCGWLSILLARIGYRTLGVDVSEEMREIATRRAEKEGVDARFAVGDMQTFDPGHEIDGAIVYNALHHVPDVPAVLRLIHKNLRPGGRLVLGEATWLHKYSPDAQEIAGSRSVYEGGFTKRQLKKMLRQAGFRRIEFYYEPGRLYTGSPLTFLKSLARFLLLRFAAYPRMKVWVAAEK